MLVIDVQEAVRLFCGVLVEGQPSVIFHENGLFFYDLFEFASIIYTKNDECAEIDTHNRRHGLVDLDGIQEANHEMPMARKAVSNDRASFECLDSHSVVYDDQNAIELLVFLSVDFFFDLILSPAL